MILEKLYPESTVRAVFLALVIAQLLLVFGHVGAIIWDTAAPSSITDILRQFFSLNKEGNAPTWFSSLLFLLIGLACSAIYFAERYATLGSEVMKRTRPFWLLFAGMFVFLSFDETSQLHERLDWMLSGLPEGGGVATAVEGQPSEQLPVYRYLLIYVPVLGVLGLAMAWFVIRRFQRPLTALLFFVGMALLAMKLVIESFEKWSLSTTWFGHAIYLEMVIVEMSSLFFGAILIFTSLLNYLFRLLRSAFMLREALEESSIAGPAARSARLDSIPIA